LDKHIYPLNINNYSLCLKVLHITFLENKWLKSFRINLLIINRYGNIVVSKNGDTFDLEIANANAHNYK